MDLDGDLDILGSNFTSSEIAWFENNGSQSFVKRAISEGFFGAWDLQIADIDSDGDKDVIGTAFMAMMLHGLSLQTLRLLQ